MNPYDDKLFDSGDDFNDVESANPLVMQILDMMRQLEDPTDIYKIQLAADAVCPRINADEIDVSQEISEALRMAKMILRDTLSSNSKPNEKASAVRTLNSALSALLRYQVGVYNVEQYKKLETALMLAIREVPNGNEFLEAFNRHYNRTLTVDGRS